MFTAALYIIAQKWKQFKHPADECIDKLWYIHTTEYYSFIKGNEALINAATWLNFENVILSQRSQMKKATYCMISLFECLEQTNPERQKAAQQLPTGGVGRNWD